MANYTAYDREDFLADETFINFLLGKNPTDVRFWKEWINNHPANRLEAEAAIELFFALHKNAVTTEQVETATDQFRRLMESGRPLPEIGARTINRKKIWIGISGVAAMVVLIVLAWNFFKAGAETKFVLYAQADADTRKVKLPDGTTVLLNSNTSLKLAENYNEDARELLLEGSAFFEVEKDPSRRFTVHAGSTDVTALGTQFYVGRSVIDGTILVSLLEGSVGVKGENKYMELTAGERAHVKKGLLLKGKFNRSQLEVWSQSRIRFQKAGMEEIAGVIEDYYHREVKISGDPGEVKFTCAFDSAQLETLMKTLQFTYNIRYQDDGKKLTITF